MLDKAKGQVVTYSVCIFKLRMVDLTILRDAASSHDEPEQQPCQEVPHLAVRHLP